MDHGGEAARPTTTLVSTTETELGLRPGVVVHGHGGSEANNTGSVTSVGQLGAATAAPSPPPGSFRHLFEFDVNPDPDGVVVQAVHGGGSYYSAPALQPLPGAELADVLPGGSVFAVDNGGDHALPRPVAGNGEVLVYLFPDGAGAGHGVGVGAAYNALRLPSSDAGRGDVLVVVDQLPVVPGSGGGTAYDDYGYHARPGAGHGELIVGLPLAGAGHDGEVFDDFLPGGGGAMHDDYGYYLGQPRPGAGRGEIYIGVLPDAGDGVVLDGSANLAEQAQALLTDHHRAPRGPNDRADYDNRGMVGEHLRRLLPLAGIGACSVAVNGLAAGPASQAVAFDMLAMFLAGLFLVIMHVRLRV